MWGERVAQHHLEAKGWKTLGRRVRFGADEIDLVMRTGDVLVFVEVKTRASEHFGRAVTAVNKGKRLALSRAAVAYLRRIGGTPVFFRFDVVEVIGRMEAAEPQIRHIEAAFQLDPKFRLPW